MPIKNNGYTTKYIIENYIQKDIEEIKTAVKKIETVVSEQLTAITLLLNWKKEFDQRKWYQKNWVKSVILVFLTTFLTALFMTIANNF
jgi:hypothetical protein